jgi:hypothetical protein
VNDLSFSKYYASSGRAQNFSRILKELHHRRAHEQTSVSYKWVYGCRRLDWRGFSQGIGQAGNSTDYTVFTAGPTAQAIAAGDSLYGNLSSADWRNLASNLGAVIDSGKDNDCDRILAPSLYSVTSEDLVSSKLNLSAFHSQVKAFYPKAHLTDVSSLMAGLDQVPNPTKDEVLDDLRRNGFIPTFEKTVAAYSQIATRSHAQASVANADYKIGRHRQAHLVEVNCATTNLVILAA